MASFKWITSSKYKWGSTNDDSEQCVHVLPTKWIHLNEHSGHDVHVATRRNDVDSEVDNCHVGISTRHDDYDHAVSRRHDDCAAVPRRHNDNCDCVMILKCLEDMRIENDAIPRSSFRREIKNQGLRLLPDPDDLPVFWEPVARKQWDFMEKVAARIKTACTKKRDTRIELLLPYRRLRRGYAIDHLHNHWTEANKRQKCSIIDLADCSIEPMTESDERKAEIKVAFGKGACIFEIHIINDWHQNAQIIYSSICNLPKIYKNIHGGASKRVLMAAYWAIVNCEWEDVLSLIAESSHIDPHDAFLVRDTYILCSEYRYSFHVLLHSALHTGGCPPEVLEVLISRDNVNTPYYQGLGNNDNFFPNTAYHPLELAPEANDRLFDERTVKHRMAILLRYGAELPGMHAICKDGSFYLRDEGLQFQAALSIRRSINQKRSLDTYKRIKNLPNRLVQYCLLEKYRDEVYERVKENFPDRCCDSTCSYAY